MCVLCMFDVDWELEGQRNFRPIKEYLLSRNVDIRGVQCDEIGVAILDLDHAVSGALSEDAGEVGLEALGRERHDHLLAFLHLPRGDDAPASLAHRATVQDGLTPTELRT